jgi:hypothetical protein
MIDNVRHLAGAWLALLPILSIALVAQGLGANHPPIALAGHDQTVGTIGVQAVAVTLYGAASSDPDGDPLTYSWRDANGHLVGSTAVVSVTLLPGSYSFALTVSDGRGGTASDGVSIIVVGDAEPPIVIAPPDITVGITTDSGAKGSDDDDLAAFLTGSNAGDLLDATPTLLGAQVNGQNVGSDYEFPIGVTPVTFRWRDHAANIGSATATVTVLEHLKKGDLLVGESFPVDYSSFGRIERVRNGVAAPFCASDSSSFDPMFWDLPSDLIVDSKGRVVFLASATSNGGDWRLLRCTRPGEPAELLANFSRHAVDAAATDRLPFPKYGFSQIGALHLAKRTVVTLNNDQNGGWPKIGDDETYNLQAGFYELNHDAPPSGTYGPQTKTFVYHVATGQWDTNGSAGIVFQDATIGDMFFNGGKTYAVHSNVIREVINPLQIDAGLKVGGVFSGKLTVMLGGGTNEYANLIMNDRNIEDVTLPPNLCGGARVPMVGGGFAPLSGMYEVLFDTWGDLGLIATSSYGPAAPFLTQIGTDMFPQPFNGCLATPEVVFAAPLPYYAANGHSNSVDRMASTKLGIVGTRYWGNDIVKIPALGGDEVETVISNIWHPMGIAGFPAKITGSYGVVIGISIQSPVNILMTDAQGRRIGMDPHTGEPVNDFGTDGVDSGPGTEPRYFFVRDPAPGSYSVQTVGTGDGPYTVDVYSADTTTDLGSRLTHTGTAAPGSNASHDFSLGADARVAFTSPSTNHAPTADAGADQTVEATSPAGATVHLDGSESSDPDGDALSYIWTGPFGILTGAVVNPVLPAGTHALTLIVDDGHGGNAKAIVVVTVTNVIVRDTTPPTISCPGEVVASTDTGRCSTAVGYTVSANDDNPGVSFTCSPASGSIFPKGTTSVSCIATDGASNTANCEFTVRVVDREFPVITCPPDITIAGNILGSCGAIVAVGSATATDNCSGVEVGGLRNHGGALTDPYPLGTTTITWTATDGAGNSSSCLQLITVTNPNPAPTITNPPTGAVYAVGTPVNFSGTFSDNPGGTHGAQWMLDSIVKTGLVNEGTGSVTATYTFTAAGVFALKLTVSDGCGGSGEATTVGGLDALVVIYDPSAGFVTGGGWINSPAGALAAQPLLTGRANFGFVSKYQRGATIPTGETEFNFKVANLNFHSTSYEWLVISGARAQYKGMGTINGAGNYGFMLTAIDGQINGGGGMDKFRIKIWDKNNGDAIVYDNQMGSADSDNPTTTLGGGSVAIQR